MNRLKELRQEKKLSQKELAKKIGVHYRTLQNWENGESQIKPDKAQALADYFGVPVGYLLGFLIDDVSEREIELHNEVISGVRKTAYIGFLDFLATTGLVLSNHQINAIFNQMYYSSEINEEYRYLEKDMGKIDTLFSITRNYIPQEAVLRFTNHIYTSEIVNEQIEKVEKILED
ncbi:helix-turn-helix domain-containing protein [Streptococcus sp. SGI.013]|uniref:helix-turn-helix domain-containing protein n=1 Tax=unclassified Streptococcus TaxID=2608887 RepID=UPI003D09178F